MEGITSVVAKVNCQNITTKEYGSFKNKEVNLAAVYSSKEGENKDFTDATPWGSIQLGITDGRPAADFFKPGKNYYVTFTEAPE